MDTLGKLDKFDKLVLLSPFIMFSIFIPAILLQNSLSDSLFLRIITVFIPGILFIFYLLFFPIYFDYFFNKSNGVISKFNKFWNKELNINHTRTSKEDERHNERFYFLKALTLMSDEFVLKNYKLILSKGIKLGVIFKVINHIESLSIFGKSISYEDIHRHLIENISSWFNKKEACYAYYFNDKFQQNLNNIFNELELYEFEKKHITPFIADFLNLSLVEYDKNLYSFLKRNNGEQKYIDILEKRMNEENDILDELNGKPLEIKNANKALVF